MDWLADILKNLTISKALVAAIFITSVVMYVGPNFTLIVIPQMQSELVPYLFAVMMFTGCLLLFWGLSAIWRKARKSVRSTARFFMPNPKLSEAETVLLVAMAQDPSQPISLDNIDYSRAPGTKLEFHHWTQQLAIKGLARVNQWDDNLVSLTILGRKRALEIQRQLKISNGN